MADPLLPKCDPSCGDDGRHTRDCLERWADDLWVEVNRLRRLYLDA